MMDDSKKEILLVALIALAALVFPRACDCAAAPDAKPVDLILVVTAPDGRESIWYGGADNAAFPAPGTYTYETWRTWDGSLIFKARATTTRMEVLHGRP